MKTFKRIQSLIDLTTVKNLFIRLKSSFKQRDKQAILAFLLSCFTIVLFLYNACSPVEFSKAKPPEVCTDCPQDSVTPTPSPANRAVSFQKEITPGLNKVDLLMVIDDSGSMLPENVKLAQRLEAFLTDLSNSKIDWRVQLTTTRVVYYEGRAFPFYSGTTMLKDASGNPLIVMTPQTANKTKIIYDTVIQMGAGLATPGGSTGADERGISSMFFHLSAQPEFYREDAAFSVIVISDEEERSVGGDCSLIRSDEASYLCRPLEDSDRPEKYIEKVKATLGPTKNFTVNSIIVKPGDSTCFNAQNIETASHYGFLYAALSNATQGYIGSICDDNYEDNLKYFKERIINSLSQIKLECDPVPVDNVDIKVKISPDISNIQWSIDHQAETLNFTPIIPENHTVQLDYFCPNK